MRDLIELRLDLLVEFRSLRTVVFPQIILDAYLLQWHNFDRNESNQFTSNSKPKVDMVYFLVCSQTSRVENVCYLPKSTPYLFHLSPSMCSDQLSIQQFCHQSIKLLLAQ